MSTATAPLSGNFASATVSNLLRPDEVLTQPHAPAPATPAATAAALALLVDARGADGARALLRAELSRAEHAFGATRAGSMPGWSGSVHRAARDLAEFTALLDCLEAGASAYHDPDPADALLVGAKRVLALQCATADGFARLLAVAASDLAHTRARLEAASAHASHLVEMASLRGGPPFHWPRFHLEALAAVAARLALEPRVRALDSALLAVRASFRTVASACIDRHGAAALATAAVESRLLGAPDGGTDQTIAAGLRAIESQLDSLGHTASSGGAGRAAAELQRQHRRLVDQADALRHQYRERTRSLASALVGRCRDGEPSAFVELEALAVACASAFPLRFAADLATLGLDAINPCDDATIVALGTLPL